VFCPAKDLSQLPLTQHPNSGPCQLPSIVGSGEVPRNVLLGLPSPSFT
jgi:hypothetical protein